MFLVIDYLKSQCCIKYIQGASAKSGKVQFEFVVGCVVWILLTYPVYCFLVPAHHF